MVATATRLQRMTETCALSVGVFEDDVLLLHLAARSQFAEPGPGNAHLPMTSEDLAFEVARLADTVTWDL